MRDQGLALVGQRVEWGRQARGLTVAELAVQARCSPDHLRKLINNYAPTVRGIRVVTILRLAKALDLEPVELLPDLEELG